MGGFEEYYVVFGLRNGFMKLDTKWWGGFEEYCVVFGLRNGLRKCFMKLDTKWWGGFEEYCIEFVLWNWIQSFVIWFEEYLCSIAYNFTLSRGEAVSRPPFGGRGVYETGNEWDNWKWVGYWYMSGFEEYCVVGGGFEEYCVVVLCCWGWVWGIFCCLLLFCFVLCCFVLFCVVLLFCCVFVGCLLDVNVDKDRRGGGMQGGGKSRGCIGINLILLILYNYLLSPFYRFRRHDWDTYFHYWTNRSIHSCCLFLTLSYIWFPMVNDTYSPICWVDIWKCKTNSDGGFLHVFVDSLFSKKVWKLI